MKFTDLMEFVKQGWKPSEIKEILSLQTESETTETTETVEASEATEESSATSTDEEATETVDYKSLYENTKEQLKLAQAENIHVDNSATEKTDEQIFSEFVESLF